MTEGRPHPADGPGGRDDRWSECRRLTLHLPDPRQPERCIYCGEALTPTPGQAA